MPVDREHRLGDSRGARFRQEALFRFLGTRQIAKPHPNLPERRKRNEEAKSAADGFTKKDGKDAVEATLYLKKMKEAEKSEDGRSLAFVKAAGTRFLRFRGMWVDERFDAESELVTVKFGSAAYFKLIEKKPELVDAFKIGSGVVYVTAKGRALVVAGEGLEEISDEQIDGLFKAGAR